MNAPATTSQIGVDSATTERFVTCTLDRELYGVPVQSVREVLQWMPVTRIPHGAASMPGVINLRGEIVPLIDLRIHLGLPAIAANERTCIIVIAIHRDGVKLQAGLIVDTALEVIRVSTAEIEAGHEAIPGRAGRYVAGITQAKTGLIVLLACESLIREALFAPASEVGA